MVGQPFYLSRKETPMNEQQRLAIGIMIVSAIQGRPWQEQVEILTATIIKLVEANLNE